jgi:signal transduction histidine kinase/DNA-binding response OmpR family regulator/HAMP domain-containing protein
VTRVAREVGTEGNLGGQAQVKGVAGTWKDLTDNVNLMAANLTEQVRGIARVVTAVANGDLRKKLSVEAKGEVAELGATINEMTDTLAIFADQVTTVAREVGVEGKLGGQANVPGASGTWKDLTDNVNQLAANLTTQLRAIAEVATSVTEGDLNREIGVAASGEVAVVKDKINQMIVNLAETTQKNAEQDWLKTNLARFTKALQGQRDLMTVSKMILSELAPLVNAQHGVFYTMDSSNPEDPILKFQAGYAYKVRKNLATVFRVGEGLVGQCALEKERILLTGVPDDYVKINSALGEATPLNIIVLPVLFEGQVRAVIELASFDLFSPIHQDFLDQLTESIGIVLNTIEANMTTEALLKQSQSLAHELQSQQEELQKTNEELEQKARLLAEQNTEVERKNLEVEQAKRSLEEKAEQLEITSRYKSEFLANMSHELRTPLNSLLILAQQLADNPEGNLSDRQVEFSRIIRSSGQDLLGLINDILDLSKIESGTVALELQRENVVDIYDFVERTFRHVADAKKLRFNIELASDLPAAITTDAKRLQQVLRNLLSNSFKFTEKGSVELRIALPTSGWSADNQRLKAGSVISFAVQDTGIGIARDKQRHIFEAFQQADGSTARKYGGTGLGLSISRELVRLLGGEIRLESELGEGTLFTVFLPTVSTQGRIELPSFPEVDEGHNNGSGERSVTQGLFRPSVRQLEELPAGIEDDRRSIGDADRTVLILEDDPDFARVLLHLAHQNGFKGLIAVHGETALLLARQFRPNAITIDLGLRDMSGWAVLDRLKHDPETADIPVHIISVFDDGAERGLSGGASTYLTKPVGKEALEGLFARIDAFVSTGGRRLLVIEDDPVQRQRIMETIATGEVEAFAVGTGKEALEVLRSNRVDCVVLDLGLPDVDGHKLIDQIHRLPGHKDLPIIIYTAAELSVNSQARLRKSTKRVILKGAESSGELATEVSRFFDRVRQARPTATAVAEPVRPPEAPDAELGGRHALVVDDDVRNIFALTALLERQGMTVLHAESGREAIQLLHENPSVEVVLMDIMMPDMDGYETMSAIRRIAGFENLAIVALTAKAMKGDREKCLEAGASDYVAKPVDAEHLLALIRSWLLN